MKRTILLAATAFALTACGGDKANDADTTALGGAAGGAAAGTVDNNTLHVSDVTLGRTVGADNRITDETDDFRPNDSIIAVVETDGAANGQALVARWTFQDGQVVEEQTQTVSSTGGKAYTQFKLSKPSGWPEGKYKLQVMLNNNEVESEEFEVKRQ